MLERRLHEVVGPVGESAIQQRVVNARTFDPGEIPPEAVKELRQFFVR
jgi:hypothetical protein